MERLPHRLPWGDRVPLPLLPDELLAFLQHVVRSRELRAALEAEAALREGSDRGGTRAPTTSPWWS